MLCPLNETKSLYSFFKSKLIFEMKSLLSSIYQLTPPAMSLDFCIPYDGHWPITNNATFLSFENQTLSGITFEQNIIN